MLIDLFLAAASVVFMIPLVTGYVAYSQDRRFWLWFTWGFFFPGISLAVLMVLLAVRRLDKGAMLVDEANRILAEAEEQERRRRLPQDI